MTGGQLLERGQYHVSPYRYIGLSLLQYIDIRLGNVKWNRRPTIINKETDKFSYKRRSVLTFLGFRQDLFSEMRLPAELN